MQDINNPERLLINARTVDGEEVCGYAVFSDYDSKWWLGESGKELDPDSMSPVSRPVVEKEGDVYCPNCDTQLGGYDDHDNDEHDPWHNVLYCPWCGQRLSWDEKEAALLDVTNNDIAERATLLEAFYRQCRELPPRSCKKLAYLNMSVSVCKDEAYPDLFDVIFLKDGIGSEDTDYVGIHLDELDDLIERVMFLGGSCQMNKKTYTIRIEQTLEGFVEIEATSEAAAVCIANDLYVAQGHELPQMDDNHGPLFFCVHENERDKGDKVELDRMFEKIREMEITPFGYILDFLIEQGLTQQQVTNWYWEDKNDE